MSKSRYGGVGFKLSDPADPEYFEQDARRYQADKPAAPLNVLGSVIKALQEKPRKPVELMEIFDGLGLSDMEIKDAVSNLIREENAIFTTDRYIQLVNRGAQAAMGSGEPKECKWSPSGKHHAQTSGPGEHVCQHCEEYFTVPTPPTSQPTVTQVSELRKRIARTDFEWGWNAAIDDVLSLLRAAEQK